MKLLVSRRMIVACVLMGALPVRAATVEIGVATKAGIESITTEATGTGSSGADLFSLPYGNYHITAAASDTSQNDLGATLRVSGSSSKPLYVYVTETGLISKGSALNLQSLFSASVPSGWSEIETTYVSTANLAYAEGAKLASVTGSGTKSVTTKGVKVGPAGSTFSLTEVFEFISDGLGGSDASSESLKAAPAPSIGAGIPSMLAIGVMLLGTKLLARWRRS